MALLMKLPNITTNHSKLVYQRRPRVAVKHLFPQKLFKTTLREQSHGAALVSEHVALEAAYEQLHKDALAGEPKAQGESAFQRYIAKAYERLEDPRSQREKWEDLKAEAEELVRSVKGLSGSERSVDRGDQERREVVADELERIGADPLLYRAVTQPEAEAPQATLADAAKVYAEEILGPNPKKSARDTFNRVTRRLAASLGPLDGIPLVDFKRVHAKKVRDDLLKGPKKGGGVLAVSSVEREINTIKSIISVGIREHDLEGKAYNPFSSIIIEGPQSEGMESEWEKRDPFSDDILITVRQRVMTHVRIPELRLIWRLLQATGCRGAEIAGLRVEDVALDHSVPHIWVRWHDERRIKTKTSTRPVPLLGDGLLAAQEAVEAAQGKDALFARYSHERGPDAVSSALMNHVRKVTIDPRLVVYSLRHNMKAWLDLSDVSERNENRILGHAEAAVGNRYYGGLDERLVSTSKVLKKALSIAPTEAWQV